MKKALIFVLSLALLLCACNAPIEPEHSNEALFSALALGKIGYNDGFSDFINYV